MPDQIIRGIENYINEICGYQFYEEIPLADRQYHVGQFFQAHVKYPFSLSPKVLEVEHVDPTNESDAIFRIADYDPESEAQHMQPIKQLNLRSTDRLYISAGKIRTVILLKIVENFWMEDEVVKLALCVPISRFKSRMETKLIIKTQLFELPQYFYIKPSENGAKFESAARFDLIQYICLDHIHPVQNDRSSLCFKLSSFSLKIMFNHLAKYLFERPYDDVLEQEISAYRDILLGEESIQSILA